MSREARHTAFVVAVALAGLALAVGLAFLASRLSAQHIGLAGEPPRAGAALVRRTQTAESNPAPRKQSVRRRTPTATTPPARVPVTPAPVVVAPAPAPAATTPPRTTTTPRVDHEGDDRAGRREREHDSDD